MVLLDVVTDATNAFPVAITQHTHIYYSNFNNKLKPSYLARPGKHYRLELGSIKIM